MAGGDESRQPRRQRNPRPIYQYDKLGRQTTTIAPQKHTSSTTTVKITNVVEYNAFGEKTYQGVMDGSANQGRQEYFDYDLAGRVWRTNAGDGITKVYLYNMAAQATAELRSQTVDLKSSAYLSSADVVGLAGLMRTETRYDTRGNVVEQRLPTWTTSNGLEQVTANAQIGAIGGINYVYWAASPDLQAGARFEYRVAGSNSNWTTAVISVPQAGSLGARVEGLVNQPYEYRISYRYTGEMSAYADPRARSAWIPARSRPSAFRAMCRTPRTMSPRSVSRPADRWRSPRNHRRFVRLVRYRRHAERRPVDL